MNPFNNNDFLNNKPEFNSTKDFYEQKHKNFFPAFLTLFLIFPIMFILQGVGILHMIIKKDSYLEIFKQATNDPSANLETRWRTNIIVATLTIAFLLAISIWYLVSWIKCIKNKDYSLFSQALIIIIIPIMFLNIILSIIFSWREFFLIYQNNFFNLFIFFRLVSAIIFIVVYMACIKKIRIAIFESNRIKRFIALQQNGEGAPIFTDFTKDKDFSYDDKNKDENLKDVGNGVFVMSPKNSENQTNNYDYYVSTLKTLDRQKLIAMAQRLNIFSADSLSTEQLIDKIALVFVDENKTQNTSIKKDPTNKDDKKDNGTIN